MYALVTLQKQIQETSTHTIPAIDTTEALLSACPALVAVTAAEIGLI